ncbi:VOC family protein [Hoeflea sp. Naph1]|uniref:VOC family protein n=1 Tax=Hoeflea sp. Naph1 TaxID=3388653 RepID=UPI00398F9295
MLKFDMVVLHVADPVASGAFYSALLERPLVQSNPVFSMLPLSDSVRLGLWAASEADPDGQSAPGASEISFNVADRESLVKRHADWVAKGHKIILDPVEMPFGDTFVAADPDGHRVRAVASTNR